MKSAKGLLGAMTLVIAGAATAADDWYRIVRDSCKEHGGFYLGSIGGVAAKLALESIKKIEVLEYPELGMEAIWKIEVENFPAFIVMDDKGNDFFDLS